MSSAPKQTWAQELAGSVAGFDGVTARERASKARILSELASLPRPFDRHASPVHVTASALVVGDRGTVLHLHKRLGLWLQPGGHIDPGERPWDAAVRETLEETGLLGRHPGGSPRLVHVDVHPAGEHVHLDLRYLLECDDREPAPAVGESPHVRWFTLAEAAAVADAGLVDAIARLQT